MKSANDLAIEFANPTNPYERNILNAATKLISEGCGHWVYYTQYSSGSTLWGQFRSKEQIIIKGEKT